MASVSQFNRIPIPLLPLEIILRNMHFYELLRLAATSENSRRLVQRVGMYRLPELSVSVHRTSVLFTLMDKRQKYIFSICTSIPRSEDTEVNAFDSLLFWMKKKPSPVLRNFTFCYAGKKFPLFTILENGMENISLVEDSEELRMDLIYTLIDFFTATFHCENFRLRKSSDEDNGITPSRFGVFIYPRPLNFRTMIITLGEWLQYRHIEALSFVKLEVYSKRLTADDMYKLINKWLSGGYNQLELIKINCWSNEEHEKVLDWTLSHRETYHNTIRGTVMSDDGRSATVSSCFGRFIFEVDPLE